MHRPPRMRSRPGQTAPMARLRVLRLLQPNAMRPNRYEEQREEGEQAEAPSASNGTAAAQP